MEGKCREAYDSFLGKVRTDMEEFVTGMDYSEIEAAANLIVEAQKNGGRVHVSGIGKPGHISGYIASLMSSTGNPTYFLHGTEAVHGSCGQLVPGDVVIFISNSGETGEMRATVTAVKNNGCRLIGVSGNPDSWLAGESDVHIFAGVKEEGGPLNRAPRLSILAETLVLQALSVVLQEHAGVTPKQYVKWHPGGKLGELRKGEEGV
ncbi:MAG TPA: SIS domain-containing protein [Firmicutes bacterium]|nr:SIS domain-containing protein [Bacillota bacterium]